MTITEASFSGFLTLKQVEHALDVSTSRVYQLVSDGRIRYVQTPLGRLYRRDDVERLAQWRAERRKERAA